LNKPSKTTLPPPKHVCFIFRSESNIIIYASVSGTKSILHMFILTVLIFLRANGNKREFRMTEGSMSAVDDIRNAVKPNERKRQFGKQLISADSF
jgi:hypothetical protein